MRFISLLLLLSILKKTCVAQYDNTKKRDSIKIIDARYSYHKLTAEKHERADVQLPYDTIVFKDVRYDTTFFAMDYPLFRISKTYNIKENFSGGFAKNISDYFNTYYATANKNAGRELICFIKKFAVTLEYDFLEHYNTGNLQDDIMNQVVIEIECYYKHDDTLFPAVKFDTTYLHHFPSFILNVPEEMKTLLKPLMKKIEQANPEHIIKRKPYTETEITNRYANRFNIPILITDTYKKGIYKNFDEFKNNSPSIDLFTITTDKLKVNATETKNFDITSLTYRALQKRNTAVFLYDENNQLISPSDVFGFCDGKTIWIQHGAFFYPLEKTGNSFEFMYIYHYNDGNDHTNTVYILSPLNMETGKSN